MALATKPSSSQRQTIRRIWKAPRSKAFWLWLAFSILLYASIYSVYLFALRTQPFPGPSNDPLRSFGILAFVLVLATASYSLRRRFVRGLPGMTRNWLWMHIWLGITAILIALLHENYTYILHDYCLNTTTCFTNAYWGTAALFALIFLVVSGIISQLLARRQAHVIAQDASTNGVGIAQALKERILELEYTVERLSAGKSEQFKHYCMQALDSPGTFPDAVPALAPGEQADFQRARDTLMTYARLTQSLQRQNRAHRIIRSWRSVHVVLACLALLVIIYHAGMELLTNVLHIVQPT
jgi:ABC-type multidrug transport system fused ATPase/permease subunit